MNIKVAIANVADSRQDFFEKRKQLVEEEIKELDWIRKEFDCIESDIIQSPHHASDFIERAKQFGAQSLIIHISIWTDPVLSIKLHNHASIPILLLGNSRPETSSFVGILGAGGALDQMGCNHIRIFDGADLKCKKTLRAFLTAASAIHALKGQTLGRFGGRSLGITTTDVDPAQWQKLFGVDIETIDQHEIIQEAEQMDKKEVERHTIWLKERINSIEFDEVFTAKCLEKQVRSYLATDSLIRKYKLDFTAVKCQSELSDGYVSQCLAHMLMNGRNDANGQKIPFVHACESDADAALTMQILKLISGNQSAALLDIRWLNKETDIWTFANCGAIPLDFFAAPEDSVGLSQVKMVPHVFGKGGGGALTGVAKPQKVTLARLCRKNGQYWMAIVLSDIENVNEDAVKNTTYAFPKVFVRNVVDNDFFDKFGSNHIHLVSGDLVEELIMFCKLLEIDFVVWK